MKSLTYALIAAVGLAALLSITLLPACLGILGRHVDALGVRTAFRVPFLRNWKVSRTYLNWLADRLQKTKTREEVEAGFWGKLVNFVMKRPLMFAIPIIVGMILLVIPLGNLSFGGISEKYLPPSNAVRVAQEHFDKLFPGYRTEQLTLVIQSDNHSPVTDQQVADIRNKVSTLTGFTNKQWDERPCPVIAGNPCVAGPNGTTHPQDSSVRVIENGLVNRSDAAKKIDELRAINPPKGLTVWVGGTPALEQDSIHALFAKAPLMLVVLVTTTMLLMFLAFGSMVLPIKAAVMSALTLGSTMGILTWIFVDGHFAKWLNFTPTPLMVVIIALVVAVGYGLATDYEVFLVSRMVEARERGMSTAEAIRIGTATTGRLITAAAMVLAVVAASFVFSDLVMMKYLAFGSDGGAVARCDRGPDVPGPSRDEAARRRLLVGSALGQAPAEPARAGRDGPPRRAQAAHPQRAARQASGLGGQPGCRDAARTARPHAPRRAGAQARPRTALRCAHCAVARQHHTHASHAKPADGRQDGAPLGAHQRGPRQPDRTRRRTTRRRARPGQLPARPPASPTPPPPAPTPSSGQTRAIPVPTNHSGDNKNDPADPTAGLPVMRSDANDSEAATEQLNARGQSEHGDNGDNSRQRRRAGGGGAGVSAQDLLRREGRL